MFLSSEEIEIECPDVYGIASSLRAYKLAWSLNQLPYFSVRKEEDIQNYVNQGYHLNYEIQDLDNDTLLCLVKNKGTEGYFYRKYKEFDFLLFSIAPELQIHNESITLIRKLKDISLCLALDPVNKPDDMNFATLL
ncbi:MAG: hypothetical protein JXR19_10795 [Bacteroidia bacterium]